MSKIPRNSIRIAIAEGGTYSPDFTYIVETDKGQMLNLVVETKDTSSSDSLRAD
ncbi:hypothetical protein [Psychrobacter sp. JCM 18901]|uniref:restriction endonuclease n=1 Tax=Psychrobacter sp. JCM 18901 TaxID=1298609 RepID=UPI00351CB549